MKKYITIIILLFLFIAPNMQAAETLAETLSGKILLQIESNGEAWYVNPSNYQRYSMGRPADAFALMKNLGIGITNNDLNKISIGLIDYDDLDNDNDGLTNRFEEAIGTNPNNIDTDNDGYNDKIEIENNYSPLSNGVLPIDNNFSLENSGKIFLQVESNGEAWYINPIDNKRYYLGRPADAFSVMQNLGLGITNSNLYQLVIGYLQTEVQSESVQIPNTCSTCQTQITSSSIMSSAASAIRTGNTEKTLSYFTPSMQKAVEYTMEFLDAEGRLTLGNILSGATLTESTENKKTYSNEVYFSLGGYEVSIYFYVEKQDDNSWLLTNL